MFLLLGVSRRRKRAARTARIPSKDRTNGRRPRGTAEIVVFSDRASSSTHDARAGCLGRCLGMRGVRPLGISIVGRRDPAHRRALDDRRARRTRRTRRCAGRPRRGHRVRRIRRTGRHRGRRHSQRRRRNAGCRGHRQRGGHRTRHRRLRRLPATVDPVRLRLRQRRDGSSALRSLRTVVCRRRDLRGRNLRVPRRRGDVLRRVRAARVRPEQLRGVRAYLRPRRFVCWRRLLVCAGNRDVLRGVREPGLGSAKLRRVRAQLCPDGCVRERSLPVPRRNGDATRSLLRHRRRSDQLRSGRAELSRRSGVLGRRVRVSRRVDGVFDGQLRRFANRREQLRLVGARLRGGTGVCARSVRARCHVRRGHAPSLQSFVRGHVDESAVVWRLFEQLFRGPVVPRQPLPQLGHGNGMFDVSVLGLRRGADVLPPSVRRNHPGVHRGAGVPVARCAIYRLPGRENESVDERRHVRVPSAR